MKKNQENSLSMFNAVIAVLEANMVAVLTLLALSNALTAFKLKVAVIKATSQGQQTSIKGVTDDKAAQKKTLIELIDPLAGLMKSFADATGNLILLAEVDFVLSDWTRMRDEDLPGHAQTIVDRATTHLAALVDYNITAPLLATVQGAIDAFEGKTGAPTAARSARKTKTKNVDTQIKEGKDFLKKRMDGLAGGLKSTFPDVASTYKNSRTIIDIGSRKDKGVAAISITDSETDAPISGALVQTGSIVRSSDAEGIIELPLVPGIYVFVVKKVGYVTFTTEEIEIKVDEEMVVTVKMVAV